MKKRIVSLVVAIAAVLTMVAPVSASNINLVIDGNRVTSHDTAPIVENGRTFVPLRLIAETFGADVSWNASRNEATIETAAYTVVFTIGSTTYTVNGARRTLDAAPRIVNGRTLVPIRAFADAIGATVDYNASTSTATVNYFTTMTGTLTIGGSTTVQPVVQAAVDKITAMNRGLRITVDGTGSGGGISGARDGSLHIGMSSREFTPEESAVLNVYAVANEGISIIIHPNNPVQNLTAEQARRIFLGEIRNWNEVGGNNAPIIVTTRAPGSGTRATFEELLLNRESITEVASPFTSNALLMQEVARQQNAIGYVSIGYLDRTVKAVTLNRIAATPETVNNGTYLLRRALYVCTSGRATGLSAIFIDYLRSEDVQINVVKAQNLVPIR